MKNIIQQILEKRTSMNSKDGMTYPNLQNFIDKYLKTIDLNIRKTLYWNLDMDANHKETLMLLEKYLPRIMENIQISEHLKHITDNVLSTRIR